MTRRQHQEIYLFDELTAKWQEDKFRRQMEIAQIGKPRIADKVLGWLIITCLVTAIVLLVKYLNHA
jgi:hypothetical protein